MYTHLTFSSKSSYSGTGTAVFCFLFFSLVFFKVCMQFVYKDLTDVLPLFVLLCLFIQTDMTGNRNRKLPLLLYNMYLEIACVGFSHTSYFPHWRIQCSKEKWLNLGCFERRSLSNLKWTLVVDWLSMQLKQDIMKYSHRKQIIGCSSLHLVLIGLILIKMAVEAMEKILHVSWYY